ncbi:MAG: S8 family serine peptidase, partial [Bacteroidales bacterium]|nr:S8 family serine peptidase [Bacteroidales bacterium]
MLAALLAVACTAEAVISEQAPENTEPVSPFVGPTATVEFDEDLTALLEESVKSADARTLLGAMGIKSLRRVFPDAGEYEARSRAMGMHRFYWVELAGVIPETKAAESLEASPGVLSVTLPRPIRRRGFFNDPYLARQWNMVNTNYPAADIHLEEVWRDYTVGNNKVIVCVVDEPVDYTHPDLIDNIWSDEEGHHGYSFVWNSYDLSLYSGDYGHATHVGGVISAMNNNGLGVSGMAGGDAVQGIPGVLLQSAAIFSGSRSANEAAAIKWGADHGAVISQNSWGYYADSNDDGVITDEEMAEFKGMSIPPATKKAIDYFIRYAGCDSEGNQLKDAPMKGGLVIFSAGNEGDMGVDYDPICDYEPVISVGAFGIDGKAAYYSNFGNWVDIAAPGGGATRREDSIWSTVPLEMSDNIGYQNIDSDGYYWVGTSMACPHVSGLAALIISYFGREGFTADQCREILFAGLGDIIGGSKPVGRKMDALASFEYGVQHYPAGGGDPLPPSIELEQNNI